MTATPMPLENALRGCSIPPRPALLMALQSEMRRDQVSLKKVAQLINRDVGMAANLLESANSAYFGLRQRVETVQEAIALIGMDHCSAVMTHLITRKILVARGMMMARFWDVSEKRAVGMRHISHQLRIVPADLGHSFGLFCDIGIPLLKANFAGYMDTLFVANRHAGTAFTKIENERHGINHAIVGALLAEKWSIAPDVIMAIRSHHDFLILFDETASAATRALVGMNYIVEKSIQEHRGETQSLEWMEGGATAMEALDLSAKDLDDICRQLKQQF